MSDTCIESDEIKESSVKAITSSFPVASTRFRETRDSPVGIVPSSFIPAFNDNQKDNSIKSGEIGECLAEVVTSFSPAASMDNESITIEVSSVEAVTPSSITATLVMKDPTTSPGTGPSSPQSAATFDNDDTPTIEQALLVFENTVPMPTDSTVSSTEDAAEHVPDYSDGTTKLDTTFSTTVISSGSVTNSNGAQDRSNTTFLPDFIHHSIGLDSAETAMTSGITAQSDLQARGWPQQESRSRPNRIVDSILTSPNHSNKDLSGPRGPYGRYQQQPQDRNNDKLQYVQTQLQMVQSELQFVLEDQVRIRQELSTKINEQVEKALHDMVSELFQTQICAAVISTELGKKEHERTWEGLKGELQATLTPDLHFERGFAQGKKVGLAKGIEIERIEGDKNYHEAFLKGYQACRLSLENLEKLSTRASSINSPNMDSMKGTNQTTYPSDFNIQTSARRHNVMCSQIKEETVGTVEQTGSEMVAKTSRVTKNAEFKIGPTSYNGNVHVVNPSSEIKKTESLAPAHRPTLHEELNGTYAKHNGYTVLANGSTSKTNRSTSVTTNGHATTSDDPGPLARKDNCIASSKVRPPRRYADLTRDMVRPDDVVQQQDDHLDLYDLY